MKTEEYPISEIIKRARLGRKAIYPLIQKYGRFSIHGSSIYSLNKRFHDLDDILLIPPQFTPLRLKKAMDLVFREPVFFDVDLKTNIGGFDVNIPLIQASMGSQDDWNKVAIFSAKACVEYGIICGIGENVSTTWGYDKRKNPKQPSFLERALSYLENLTEKGGLIIQQNEEEAFDELWNKIYSDKRFDVFIQEGKIAFEIKAGQGAKPGLGGEKIVSREEALKLKSKYYIYPDPEKVNAEYYERHSSPDIFTEEILEYRIKKLRNDYPRVKIWVKTGPYRDIDKVIEISYKAGAHCVVIDGKEGGTGMSPTVALQELGLPTIACLAAIRRAKMNGMNISLVISGRLYNGSHLVKSLALGADGIAMGRPFLIASYAYPFSSIILKRELYKNRFLGYFIDNFFHPNEKSIIFVKKFIESIKVESQMIISSLGKYNINDLNSEDIIALNRDLARMLKIKYIYDMFD
jgi:hypothetical protein